ncbi:hypothetical protein [Dokdonia sp.]|uniref:hypothetical protein n=1 Tax=Dokdonia sp. TaxID=2024995 RepID=UPI0032673590
MENLNEFSFIEQAAMEQSPAHETDVRHNFVEASSFIDDIANAVENAADDVGHAVENVATGVAHATVGAVKAVTPETPDVAEVTIDVAAAAGGIVVDHVFTKEHATLLKSVNQECSIDELIDLRCSLIKANRMQK